MKFKMGQDNGGKYEMDQDFMWRFGYDYEPVMTREEIIGKIEQGSTGFLHCVSNPDERLFIEAIKVEPSSSLTIMKNYFKVEPDDEIKMISKAIEEIKDNTSEIGIIEKLSPEGQKIFLENAFDNEKYEDKQKMGEIEKYFELKEKTAEIEKSKDKAEQNEQYEKQEKMEKDEDSAERLNWKYDDMQGWDSFEY